MANFCKETPTNQKEKTMSMRKSVPVVEKGVTLINGVRASEISDESLIFEISQLKAQTEALKSSMEGLSSSYIQAKVYHMEQILKDLVEVLDSRTVASLGSVSWEFKAKAEGVSGAEEGEPRIF